MAICMFYTFLSFVPFPTRYLSFSLICKSSWYVTIYDNEGIRLGRMLMRLSHVVHTHTIECTSIWSKDQTTRGTETLHSRSAWYFHLP